MSGSGNFQSLPGEPFIREGSRGRVWSSLLPLTESDLFESNAITMPAPSTGSIGFLSIFCRQSPRFQSSFVTGLWFVSLDLSYGFQDEFVTSQLLLWPHNLLNTSYYWQHILSGKRLDLSLEWNGKACCHAANAVSRNPMALSLVNLVQISRVNLLQLFVVVALRVDLVRDATTYVRHSGRRYNIDQSTTMRVCMWICM